MNESGDARVDSPRRSRPGNHRSARFRAVGWRLVTWALLIGVVVAVAWAAFSERPLLVDTATIDRGPLEVDIRDDGVTRIRERYVVSTPLAGRVRRIAHDVGDPVTAHQSILARMEPNASEMLDPRAAAQAQSRVRAAERRLAQAKSQRQQAELLVNFAEREMGRLRRLRENGAASESEFLEQELEFHQQQENAASASYAVDIAEYELELEKAALMLTGPRDEASGDQESVLEIPAPITGRILRLHQESGGVVPAGAPLVELGDPADLEIVAEVLSRDAVRIKPGNRVSLERWGGGEPLEGRVRLVEPSGFTKVSALGVEEQRVNVIIDLTGPSDDRASLGDHFRVDCRIIIWSADDVLRVPTAALFRVDERWQLFRVVDGRASLTRVEIGRDNGEHAEVIRGIDLGDQVIVYPSQSVTDGTLVAER